MKIKGFLEKDGKVRSVTDLGVIGNWFEVDGVKYILTNKYYKDE